MRVILLAGYRETSPESCPWLELEDGVPRLQKRILEAKNLTPNRIVVLGGDSAEATLRHCPAIESCELVFDTSVAKPNLISNLRAALKLGHEPAIVLPAEMSFGDLELVRRLAAVVIQNGLQAPFHGVHSLLQGGLPLVLTQNGCRVIADELDVCELADPRLEYRNL